MNAPFDRFLFVGRESPAPAKSPQPLFLFLFPFPPLFENPIQEPHSISFLLLHCTVPHLTLATYSAFIHSFIHPSIHKFAHRKSHLPILLFSPNTVSLSVRINSLIPLSPTSSKVPILHSVKRDGFHPSLEHGPGER